MPVGLFVVRATIARDREVAFNKLRTEYDKHFGDVSERSGQAWVQVFP